MGSNASHCHTDTHKQPTDGNTRYLSHDAHHLQILVCKPFDSNESPFGESIIRYIKDSRFFIFDLMKNSNDITYNHTIQCVKLIGSLFIGTNNGGYCVNNYMPGLLPIQGLEGQNIIDFDDTAEHFLTAEGNVFYKEDNFEHKPAVEIPLSELGGYPIIKVLQSYEYLSKSPLFLINDQNQLLIRKGNNTGRPIQLKNTSVVVDMFKSEAGALFTIHKNGKVELAYRLDNTQECEYAFLKLIANHNIVKASGTLSQRCAEMYFLTDKGLIIPYLYKTKAAFNVSKIRALDVASDPYFTYVDYRGDFLFYHKYLETIKFMDKGSGYFNYLVGTHTKVKPTQDSIIIYVTKDIRGKKEMNIMYRQASKTFTLIDVDIITLQ